MAKKILCFGDSNTWGYCPDGKTRYDSSIRWPAIMQKKLGAAFDIIEEGHCGRTTIYDDPETPGRNGSTILPSLIEKHAPLDLIIIMLGTNDFKSCYSASNFDIAQSLEKLSKIILTHNAVQTYFPKILLIAPPPISNSVNLKESYINSIEKSHIVGDTITDYFNDTEIYTFDAGGHIQSSIRDGIHLEPSEHIKLGKLIAQEVKLILL